MVRQQVLFGVRGERAWGVRWVVGDVGCGRMGIEKGEDGMERCSVLSC